MANVLFKQGTQENLDAIRVAKSATDGTFYLTNDSRRLYIGTSSGDAIPVNEGVTTVNTIDDLPRGNLSALHAGQFYYVIDKNILCVNNGQTWVQLNPNTNTVVKNLDITVEAINNVATVKTVITLDGVVNADGTITNGKQINDTHKIQGAGGLLVEKNATGDGVVLTGDVYDLGLSVSEATNTANISLTSTNTNNDTQVQIVGGNNVTLTKNGNGQLSIAATDTKIASVNIGHGSNANDTASNKQGFYVEVKDTSGKSAVSQFNPQIRVGTKNSSYVYEKIINGVVTLPVYTKEEIDAQFFDFNVMTYCGTLGEGGSNVSLPSTLHNGDTFMIVGGDGFNLTLNGVEYSGRQGDLFIVRGVESKGEIVSNTAVIDIVPSGDDAAQDTTYKVVPSANGFQIKESGTSGKTVGSFYVNGDNDFLIATDNQDATQGKNTVTISHKKITVGDTSGVTSGGNNVEQVFNTSFSVPVVSSIVRDAAGHVKEVQVKNYIFKDTNGHIADKTTYAATMATGTNAAVINSETKFFASSGAVAGTAKGQFGIASSSLAITASGSNITVDLEWGTF